MKMRLNAGALLGVALAAAWTQTASAAPATAGSLDTITELFKNGAAAWESTLAGYAMGLFGLLVAIEVTFTMVKLALKGADMTEFGSELINRMMVVGFFTWLLTNSSTFARAIIDSLRQAGDSASVAGGGTAGIAPSDLFDAGVNMATAIFAAKVDMSLAGLGQFLALSIAGLVVCACFALIAAFMIVALVESYIVISAGVILMGFGGSRWTKDFATKTLTYALSVGAKLFVLQLIAGLGEAVVKSQAANIGVAKPADVLVLLGFAVVMLALVKTIPDAVQGLINGSSIGNGGGLAAAGIAGAAAGAIGGAAAGGASALLGASKLAGAQAAAGTGSGGFGGVMKNLGGAAMSDVGARLGGRANGGSMAGRMGHQMSQQASQLTQSMEKPMPPMSMGGGAEAQKAPAGEGSIRGGGEAAGASASQASADDSGASAASGASASASGSATEDPVASAAAAYQGGAPDPGVSAGGASGQGSGPASDPMASAAAAYQGGEPGPSQAGADTKAPAQDTETSSGKPTGGQTASAAGGGGGIGERLGGRGTKPGGGSV